MTSVKLKVRNEGLGEMGRGQGHDAVVEGDLGEDVGVALSFLSL